MHCFPFRTLKEDLATRTLSLNVLLMVLAAYESVDPLSSAYTFALAVPPDPYGFGDEASIDDESVVLPITDDDNVTVQVGASDGIRFLCSLDPGELALDSNCASDHCAALDTDTEIPRQTAFGPIGTTRRL